MRKLFTALVLAASVSLGGCATFQNAKNTFDIVTSARASPTAIIVAAQTFDALEVSATNYLRLPKCTAVSGPVCRNRLAANAIIKAVRTGRPVRNQLEAFLRDHPGELGPKGLYDALTGAAQTIQGIFTAYQIGGAQ